MTAFLLTTLATNTLQTLFGDILGGKLIKNDWKIWNKHFWNKSKNYIYLLSRRTKTWNEVGCDLGSNLFPNTMLRLIFEEHEIDI